MTLHRVKGLVEAAPMSEAPDLHARFEALERRVAQLETKHRELSPTVEEHDDRLDSHDMQLAKLSLQMTQMVAEQHRLADELTKQSGTLELILRNTASIAAALGVAK